MAPKLHVRPAQGLQVRGPDGRLLPDKGGMVDNTGFWRRRLAYGDVVEIKSPVSAPTGGKDGDSTKGKKVGTNA